MQRNTVIVFRVLLVSIGVSLLTGCIEIVKTDLDTYLQDQKAFRRKHVIFTTTLEDLLTRHELYQGKEVELSAPVSYFGKEDFPTWYLTLERDGKQLRAYEDSYRNYVDIYTLNLMIWVKSEGGEVTVRGKLKEKGIELNQLAYKEYYIDTDALPLRDSRTSDDRPPYFKYRQGYRY